MIDNEAAIKAKFDQKLTTNEAAIKAECKKEITSVVEALDKKFNDLDQKYTKTMKEKDAQMQTLCDDLEPYKKYVLEKQEKKRQAAIAEQKQADAIAEQKRQAAAIDEQKRQAAIAEQKRKMLIV